MEMISANVPRQGRAEVNVRNRTQERELPILERVAGTALIPAVVEFEDTHHLGIMKRYYEAMTDLQYPIGRFTFPESTTAEQRQAWIREIARTPQEMRAAVAGLSKEQLDTPYRPGGWTVRQVVHHVPDSHMNAFIRFKLALTEDQPTIKPYDEARWAVLADAALPGGAFARSARSLAPPLGGAAGIDERTRLSAHLRASGIRRMAAGSIPGAVCLAWPASHGHMVRSIK